MVTQLSSDVWEEQNRRSAILKWDLHAKCLWTWPGCFLLSLLNPVTYHTEQNGLYTLPVLQKSHHHTSQKTFLENLFGIDSALAYQSLMGLQILKKKKKKRLSEIGKTDLGLSS